MTKKLIIGGVIGVVVVAIVSILLTWNATINEGNNREAELNGQYVDNQNILSQCVTTIRETANVAQAQSNAFTKALEDAIKGRYDGRSAQPGQMFSAIVENYPDLSGLNKAFERVHLQILQCRGDFSKVQSKLIDRLQKYDAWRNATTKGRIFASNRPSDHLVAAIGNDRSRKGQDAYDQMWTIVTTADTKEAYREGNLKPEEPFSTAPATPAK